MRGWRAATVAALAMSGVLPAAAAAHDHGAPVRIDVLSSRPDQVSGGDALVRVQAPPGLLHRLRLERNGTDVTSALAPRAGGLAGVVDGFSVGRNELTAVRHHRRVAELRITDYPITGPIFSGPQQAPFVCKTNQTQPPL